MIVQSDTILIFLPANPGHFTLARIYSFRRDQGKEILEKRVFINGGISVSSSEYSDKQGSIYPGPCEKDTDNVKKQLSLD